MKEIRGCNALLTGASRGIGVAIANRLAEEGVNLALVARTADALERVRDEVTQKGVRAIAVPADLSQIDYLEKVVQIVEQDLGPIDLLINNAAIEKIAAYETISNDEIETIIAVNLTAPMILTRLLLPKMLARARGHVVNISSVEGFLPFPLSEAYAASKHAINGFTICLHLTSNLYKSPVSSSVICPAFIGESGMYQRCVDAYRDKGDVLNRFRTSKPKEVADAVVRSIQRDEVFVIVGKLPFKIIHSLSYFAPRLTLWVAKSTGCYAPFKFIAEVRGLGRKPNLRSD
jgi:short-subunit dehydrogenase